MISDEAFKRIHARLQKPFVKRVAKSDEERGIGKQEGKRRRWSKSSACYSALK